MLVDLTDLGLAVLFLLFVLARNDRRGASRRDAPTSPAPEPPATPHLRIVK